MGLSKATSISEVRTTPTRFSTRCRPRHIALTQVSPGATKKKRKKSQDLLPGLSRKFPFQTGQEEELQLHPFPAPNLKSACELRASPGPSPQPPTYFPPATAPGPCGSRAMGRSTGAPLTRHKGGPIELSRPANGHTHPAGCSRQPHLASRISRTYFILIRVLPITT